MNQHEVQVQLQWGALKDLPCKTVATGSPAQVNSTSPSRIISHVNSTAPDRFQENLVKPEPRQKLTLPETIFIKINHADEIRDVKKKIEKAWKKKFVVEKGAYYDTGDRLNKDSTDSQVCTEDMNAADDGSNIITKVFDEIKVKQLRIKQTLNLPDLCKVMSVFTPTVDVMCAFVEFQARHPRFMVKAEESPKKYEPKMINETSEHSPAQDGSQFLKGSNPNINCINQFYYSKSSFYNSRQNFTLGDIRQAPFVFKETHLKQAFFSQKRKNLTLLQGMSTPSLKRFEQNSSIIQPQQASKILISEEQSQKQILDDVVKKYIQDDGILLGANKIAPHFNQNVPFKTSEALRKVRPGFEKDPMFATTSNNMNNNDPVLGIHNESTTSEGATKPSVQQSRTHLDSFYAGPVSATPGPGVPFKKGRGSLPPLEKHNSKINTLGSEEQLGGDVIGSSRGGNRKVAQTPRNMVTLTAVANKTSPWGADLPEIRLAKGKVHRNQMASQRHSKDMYLKRASHATKYLMAESQPITPAGMSLTSRMQISGGTTKNVNFQSAQMPGLKNSGFGQKQSVTTNLTGLNSNNSLEEEDSDAAAQAEAFRVAATPAFGGNNPGAQSNSSFKPLDQPMHGSMLLKNKRMNESDGLFMDSPAVHELGQMADQISPHFLALQFQQIATSGQDLDQNGNLFCETILAMEQQGIFGMMQMVHDKEMLVNAMYLFTLGSLSLPHHFQGMRRNLCQRIIKTLTPEMVATVLQNAEVSYRLVDAVWALPLSIRKDTISVLLRILNLASLCVQKKALPTLDWLIEVLRCPSPELKASCLRLLVEKTSEYFKIDEERLQWVSQIKPDHLVALRKTFQEDNPMKVKDLAAVVQDNLRFIIKNHKHRMTFLKAAITSPGEPSNLSEQISTV